MSIQEDPQASPVTDPDWRAVLESRWAALRREVFDADCSPRRKLSALGHECVELAIVKAWFEAEGNITLAATRLGSNRRTVRDHLVRWRSDHPLLVPSRPDDATKHRRERKHSRKNDARRSEHDDNSHTDPMDPSATHGARQP